MRTLAGALALVLTAAAGPTGPTPRPVVTVGELHGPAHDGTYLVRLVATDPDGSPVAFDVDWGDGQFAFIDTICLGDGEPLVLRLPHAYQPGSYEFRARATSVDDCRHGGDVQRGPWSRARFTVPPST